MNALIAIERCHFISMMLALVVIQLGSTLPPYGNF